MNHSCRFLFLGTLIFFVFIQYRLPNSFLKFDEYLLFLILIIFIFQLNYFIYEYCISYFTYLILPMQNLAMDFILVLIIPHFFNYLKTKMNQNHHCHFKFVFYISNCLKNSFITSSLSVSAAPIFFPKLLMTIISLLK